MLKISDKNRVCLHEGIYNISLKTLNFINI